MERIRRKEPTYTNIDYTKPVDTEAYIKEVEDGDCFSVLFQADDSSCALCADKHLCHRLYHDRQTKKVKQLEKNKGGYLDSSRFDCLPAEDVLTWLKRKPRTGKQFIDKVAEISRCPDRPTVHAWCKSFILEHNLSVENKIIVV